MGITVWVHVHGSISYIIIGLDPGSGPVWAKKYKEVTMVLFVEVKVRRSRS